MIKEGSSRVLILTIIYLLLSHVSWAQEEQNQRWMVYGQGGVGFRFPNTYGPELNLLLNESEDYPQLLPSFGLGLIRSMNEKLSLGIDLYGFDYPRVKGVASSVKELSWGGSIRINYNLVEASQWKLMTFVGLGLDLSNTVIKNEGFLVNRSPIYIPPAQEQTIRGQLGMVDFGLQVLRKTKTSFSLGVTGGFQQRLIGSDWKATWGEPVTFLSVPAHSIFYGRVMVCYSIR